jgi:hypothetical protein
MATWHQRQRPVRLDHPTAWMMIVDPPNDFAYGIGCQTEAEAKTLSAKFEHSYVLPPRNLKADQ